MTPRPRALIFDWDNTLVDSWPTIHEALNKTLAAMGHAPWSLEESKERVRLSLRDSFPLLFKDRWQEARRIYLDAFLAVHIERLTVLPGVETLLDRLKAEGLYLAVVSNKTGPILRRESEKLGWDHYFGRLVGATDAPADKPDPAPVHLALDGSGIAAGPEVWFIGDTAVDMQCALGAGCVPVLLGPSDPASAEFAAFKPNLAFHDCEGLFLHLRTL
ncbi:MAG: HAD family hydrolase [Alphaproteobacteria bacterium]|nr:HAD family hydrolase [Alphaproteobacteria bacterium]